MKLETLKQAMAQYENVKATFEENKNKKFEKLYNIFEQKYGDYVFNWDNDVFDVGLGRIVVTIMKSEDDKDSNELCRILDIDIGDKPGVPEWVSWSVETLQNEITIAEKTKFIGNTKIIAPSELPKIGDKGGVGHTNEICVSVELTETPKELIGYICYNVYYANLGEYFDKDINICRFSMAIKLSDFVRFHTEVK